MRRMSRSLASQEMESLLVASTCAYLDIFILRMAMELLRTMLRHLLGSNSMAGSIGHVFSDWLSARYVTLHRGRTVEEDYSSQSSRLPYADILEGSAVYEGDPSMRALWRVLCNTPLLESEIYRKKKRGHALKVSKHRRSLNKRWLVLEDGVLRYFISPADEGPSAPKGRFVLREFSLQKETTHSHDICDEDGISKAYYRIVLKEENSNPEEAEGVLAFVWEDEELRDEWYESLLISQNKNIQDSDSRYVSLIRKGVTWPRAEGSSSTGLTTTTGSSPSETFEDREYSLLIANSAEEIINGKVEKGDELERQRCGWLKKREYGALGLGRTYFVPHFFDLRGGSLAFFESEAFGAGAMGLNRGKEDWKAVNGGDGRSPLSPPPLSGDLLLKTGGLFGRCSSWERHRFLVDVRGVMKCLTGGIGERALNEMDIAEEDQGGAPSPYRFKVESKRGCQKVDPWELCAS